MSRTKIQKCSCKHAYQDKRYGAGKRVFNAGAGKENEKYSCTVRGKEK